MSSFLLAAGLFLMINLAIGLLRLNRGPGPADRIQALLLFGTTTVGVLLLLAYSSDLPALVHVALVFVMLAAIASIAFVQLPHHPGED